MAVEGIILAGGQSRRFGTDKALAQYQGKKMIEASVQVLRGLGIPVTVIAPRERDYSFLNCRIAPDLIAGLGPLGGIHTAFSLYPKADLLVLTCDMPRLTECGLKPLIEAYAFDDAKELIIWRHPDGSRQPFPGLYGVNLADRVFRALTRGDLSMKQFLADTPALKELMIQASSEFININHSSDLSL